MRRITADETPSRGGNLSPIAGNLGLEWANVTLVLVRTEPLFGVSLCWKKDWDYRAILRNQYAVPASTYGSFPQGSRKVLSASCCQTRTWGDDRKLIAITAVKQSITSWSYTLNTSRTLSRSRRVPSNTASFSASTPGRTNSSARTPARMRRYMAYLGRTNSSLYASE